MQDFLLYINRLPYSVALPESHFFSGLHLCAVILFIKPWSLVTSHTNLALPGLNLSRGLISQNNWKHLCSSAGPLNGSHSVEQVVLVELIAGSDLKCMSEESDKTARYQIKKKEKPLPAVNRHTNTRQEISLQIHSLQALSTHLHCSPAVLSSLRLTVPPALFSLWSFYFYHDSSSLLLSC